MFVLINSAYTYILDYIGNSGAAEDTKEAAVSYPYSFIHIKLQNRTSHSSHTHTIQTQDFTLCSRLKVQVTCTLEKMMLIYT